MYRVLYIPGGAGFRPSRVSSVMNLLNLAKQKVDDSIPFVFRKQYANKRGKKEENIDNGDMDHV